MDNIKLPEGWKSDKLGNLVEIITGRLDANNEDINGLYPFFTCAAEPIKINSYSFDDEAIILPGNGANVGLVLYYSGKFEAYQRTYVITKFPGELRYLYYYMKMHWKRYNDNKQYGSATNYIKMANITEFQVVLPPLETQKRIVEILERAEKALEKRKEAVKLLDELVKSRFIEMFGDPYTNPMGWMEGTVRDIVTEVKYGTSKPAIEGGKYKYLRMNNITYNGELDISDLKYIDIPEKDIEKCIVRKGDVLFNRTNSKELVGKTCVFNLDEPMVIAGYIIRVRMNERALPEYLSAVLNSKYGKEVLYGMCKAIVGQANINAQELQDIKIFIPPIELQKQYVDFIKQVDRLKFEMEVSLKELENNFNSLMQRAFNGELFN